MKLIVGLGNPGGKYSNTRHNVGFMVLDALASQISNFQFPISNEIQNSNFKLNKKLQSLITIHQSLVLAKSQTFMNESGKSVKKLVAHFRVKLSNLRVIHDDLDIRLGDYKIQMGKGPREHNGLLSIYNALGTKDFWHVRIGVDNRTEREKVPGEQYVLQNFTNEELDILNKVVEKVVGDLLSRLDL